MEQQQEADSTSGDNSAISTLICQQLQQIAGVDEVLLEIFVELPLHGACIHNFVDNAI